MCDIKELQEKILKFRDDRNWKQFHTIKDILLGMNIEVGELQEIFLWTNDHIKIDVEHVGEEIADIFIFLTYVCDMMNLDLKEIVERKIVLNGIKYPVHLSKNSNKKYNEL